MRKVVSFNRYTVTVDRKAARQLLKMPATVYETLSKAIDGLAFDPRPPGY